MRDALTLKQRLEHRWGALKTIRTDWDEHAYDLARFIAPHRSRRLTTDKGAGKKHGAIINGSATWALRTMAAGMRAGTASPDIPWFRLKPEDDGLAEFKPVKDWLEWPMRTIYSILAASNFYEEYHTALYELGLFGTQALAHNDDRQNIAHFQAWTWGRYCLANDEKGRARTIYREYQDTVENVARRWGRDRLSIAARNALDSGKVDHRIDIVQAMEPYAADRWGGTAARRWSMATAYYERAGDGDRLLFVGGADELPVHASRWEVVLPDAYGYSPAMEALGDVKQLQLQERRKAQAIDQLGGMGAMQGPPLIRGVLDRQPGAYNEINGFSQQARAVPLIEVPPATVQVMSGDVQSIEERIRHAFFADLFLMLAMSDRRQITATEVLERHEEKMLVLGPVLTRLSSELLSSVIERLFATIVRASAPLWPDAGIIPPPPAELQGEDLAIDYTSTLFAAQKAMQVGPMQQWVSLTDQIAATQPDALDKRNADAMVEHYADLLGVSPKVYRGDEEVAAMREARQAQMAAQQAGQVGLDMVSKLGSAKTEGTVLGQLADMVPAP